MSCPPATKPREKLKVIMDSNAFFVPLKLKIDIFEETSRLLNRNVDFILLSHVKAELELLARRDSLKTRREAAYALKLTEKCRLVAVDKAEGSATDDVIAQVAEAWKCPVFTNDRQLRSRLKHIRVPVIYVRQKSRLDIDGLI